MRICLLGCLLRYLVKSLIFNGTIFEQITLKQCPPHLGISMTWNHLVKPTKQVVCEFSCGYTSSPYTLLDRSKFPARIPNESRLYINIFEQ